MGRKLRLTTPAAYRWCQLQAETATYGVSWSPEEQRNVCKTVAQAIAQVISISPRDRIQNVACDTWQRQLLITQDTSRTWYTWSIRLNTHRNSNNCVCKTNKWIESEQIEDSNYSTVFGNVKKQPSVMNSNSSARNLMMCNANSVA